jgi:hypothetical protein
MQCHRFVGLFVLVGVTVCNLNNEIPYFPFSAYFLQLPKVVASAVSVILDFTWFSQFFFSGSLSDRNIRKGVSLQSAKSTICCRFANCCWYQNYRNEIEILSELRQTL